MTGVYVAAGSSVDARTNLRKAVKELRRRFGELRLSPAYQNAAVGFEGDDFINLVAGFDTNLDLPTVITVLQSIEAMCGRARDAPKWAPRTMDLDILLFGDLVLEQPGIKLPRPDLIRRPYMLGPLADIAPELVHPLVKRRIGELWKEFDHANHPMAAVDLEWQASDSTSS